MIDLDITEELASDQSLGAAFGDLSTWSNWLIILRALFALPLSEAELAVFRELTGRSRAPRAPAREFFAICGRRSGKSRIVAAIACFLGCFTPVRKFLAPGEKATVLVLAQDRRAAKTVHGYVRALLHGVPMLKRMIIRETSEEIELSNGVVIAIMTASFRSVRSYTALAVIADEVAYWMDAETGANPAQEILASLRPALVTIPCSMLLAISSPYRRAGPSFEAFRDYYGVDDDRVLVVKAPSTKMNPTLDDTFIAQEFRRDPQRAQSEWNAEFRSDLAAFLDDELIHAAVDHGRPFDLPPQSDQIYRAFVDPSGGRGDSMTLCIAHREDDQVIVDVIRGRSPPFIPGDIVSEFSSLLKRYSCSSVVGDRYSAEWVVSAFRENGISYETCPKPKAEVYLETLPLWTTGQIRIPDAKATISELRALERHTGRSGRDSVDHPRGSHDDHANALCGALWLLSEAPVEITPDMFWYEEASVGAQLRTLQEQGIVGTDAMMAVERPTPLWEYHSLARSGPFIPRDC
jgi:hypothetical protein